MAINLRTINLFDILVEKLLPKIPLPIFIGLIIIHKIPFDSNSIFTKIVQNIKLFLITYLLTKDNTSIFVTFSAVLIAFYIAIISVFGSTRSFAISKISQYELVAEFVNYSRNAIISTFLFFMLTLLWSSLGGNTSFIFLFTGFLFLVLFNLSRFTNIVFKIYEINIKNAHSDEINEQNYRNKLIRTVNEIENSLNTDTLYSKTKIRDMNIKIMDQKNSAPEISTEKK